jgi:DNA-binding NarL/FixJ family response regulator
MAGLIRLVIIEDHPATAAGLAQVLNGPQVAVVGVATSASRGIELIAQAMPDLVLCDIALDSDSQAGFRLMERYSDTGEPAFLLFSAHDYPALWVMALERGAAGFLPKTATVEDILSAIVTIGAGGAAFSAQTIRAARQSPRRPSDREMDVLTNLVGGASNEDIAQSLTIGVKTIESHLRRMYGRYGVTSRTALVMTAVRQGWVEPD